MFDWPIVGFAFTLDLQSGPQIKSSWCPIILPPRCESFVLYITCVQNGEYILVYFISILFPNVLKTGDINYVLHIDRLHGSAYKMAGKLVMSNSEIVQQKWHLVQQNHY